MFSQKWFCITVVLIGLQDVNGYPHPNPFVSSSGMIPMQPRKNVTNESTTSTTSPTNHIITDTTEIPISEEDEDTSEIPAIVLLPPPETTTDTNPVFINRSSTPDMDVVSTRLANTTSDVKAIKFDILPDNLTILETTVSPETETKSPVVIHKFVEETVLPDKNVTKRKVDELPPDLGTEPEIKVQLRPHRQNDYTDLDNMDMNYAENVDDETSDSVPPPTPPPLTMPPPNNSSKQATNSSKPNTPPPLTMTPPNSSSKQSTNSSKPNTPPPLTIPPPNGSSKQGNTSKPNTPPPLTMPPPSEVSKQGNSSKPTPPPLTMPPPNGSSKQGTNSSKPNTPPPLTIPPPNDPIPPMFVSKPAKPVNLTLPTHSLIPPLKPANPDAPAKNTSQLPFIGQTFDEKKNLKYGPKFDYDADNDKPEEIDEHPLSVTFDEENTIGNSARSEDVHDDEFEEPQQLHESFDEHFEPNITNPGEEVTPVPPYPKYLIGAPWDDEQIVGEMSENKHIPKIEISFKLAAKLCQSMEAQNQGAPKLPQYYLWAPILQYVPLIHKPYPLRAPIFTHECLKWVLQQCRGPSRLPMVQPCTYWAPMRINRPECGFSPRESSKMVNFRLPDYVPGNCPCVWPCERRFDPIQRCRIHKSKNDLAYDGIGSTGEPEPLTEIRIQENYAKQLCRSMATATTSNPITISSLPIRTGAIVKPKKAKETLTRKRHAKDKTIFKRSGDGSDEFDFVLTTSFDYYAHDDESLGQGKTLPGGKSSAKNTHDIGVGQTIDDKASHEESDAFLTITFNPSDTTDGKTSEESAPVFYPIEERCLVWEYKACGKGSSEEDSKETYDVPKRVKRGARNAALQKKRKGKGRSLIFQAFDEDADYDTVVGNASSLDGRSFLSIIFDEEGSAVAQGEGDISPDDRPSQNDVSNEELNVDCDKWLSQSAEDCYPETLPDGQMKDTHQAVRDVCGGSDAKFPCFTRKKREADDGVEDNWNDEDGNDEAQKETELKGEEPPVKEPQGKNETTEDKKPDNPNPDHKDEDDSNETGDKAVSLVIQLEPDANGTRKTDFSSPFENKVKILPDDICRCDWPCLPFYDSINQCYDENGSVLITPEGKPVVPVRSFRKYQRGPVICMNFVNSDEVICKVKGKKRKLH